MIPGVNLLSIATRAVGTETVLHLEFEGRVENALGEWVTKYSEPEAIRGSWQAVPRDAYGELGLDESKSYFNLYTVAHIKGVEPNRSPDRIVRGGRLYDVKSVTPWGSIAGWNAVLCVDIGAA